jgi:hypothetical protein
LIWPPVTGLDAAYQGILDSQQEIQLYEGASERDRTPDPTPSDGSRMAAFTMTERACRRNIEFVLLATLDAFLVLQTTQMS